MQNYILMLVLPVPLTVVLSYLMMKKSFKRSREVGIQNSKMEQDGLIRLLLIFSGILFAIDLLVLVIMLVQVEILGTGFKQDKITPTLDMGVTLMCLSSFFLAVLMGFNIIRQNKKEVERLDTVFSPQGAEIIKAERDPRQNMKTLVKLILLTVVAALMAAAALWLIRVDPSVWEDSETMGTWRIVSEINEGF